MKTRTREPFFTTRNIASLSFLAAITVLLQVMGNFINVGVANINLSLVPITVAALVFGPLGGALMGFLNGLIVLFSPSTIAVFWPVSGVGTVLACLLKTTAAGAIAGLIFKPFKGGNKELLGAILACISVPIINTGIFSLVFMLFFTAIAEQNGSDNALLFLIVSVIGINFIFELLANSLLSQAVYTIYRYFKKSHIGKMDNEEPTNSETKDESKEEQ